MNKFILALTLTLLAPFFLQANIFEDGSVNMQEPLTISTSIINCSIGSNLIGQTSIQSPNPSPLAMDMACVSVVSPYLESHPSHTQCGNNVSVSTDDSSNDTNIVLEVTYPYKDFRGICSTSQKSHTTYGVNSGIESISEVEECDDGLIDYQNSSSELKCFSALDAQQGDSCDYNDVYSNPVTESAACIVKDDKSMCAVSAVPLPNSSESVYMPTENDCYSDVYPILDENGGIGNMPDGSDQQCTESGALSYCPADPSEVCPNGVCDAGCGNMNGTFVCIAPLEPPDVPCTGDDCGEGETPPPCTGDDCGEGETPTPCTGDDCGEGETPTPCTGDDCGVGTGGGGDKEGFCDKEGNCETGITTKTEPSDGLEGFWKSDYPDGINGIVDGKISDAKNTEFFVFLESFNPTLGNGSEAPMQMCFNLGSMGNFGCQSFKIDPRVYPAIRIFILITAGFLCRKILFGG